MTSLTGLLGGLPAPAAYAVLAESVLLLGAFVPTLTLLLAAGALARGGGLHLAVVVAVAAGAVVAGDALGHRTGRALGGRLRTGRIGRRVPAAAWWRAEHLMDRHGGRAVLLCRFVPVVRTLAPHLAGATRLPYRRIAPYSLAAAVLWAGAEAAAGYVAADAARRAVAYGGPAIALVALGAVAALAGASVLRRRAGGAARRHLTPPLEGAKRLLPVRHLHR
ncbi:DedA family protein [Streptomyces sp. NPDC060194]|uniref:DedA family protein n=1 Tax=Streptomyces sp. NPDC060194 TaxID=3347069 RepID=UPI0036551C0C